MKRWLGALIGIGFLALLWWHRPAGQEVPKQAAIREPSEDVVRCRVCHASQSEEFLTTGHALALRLAHDPEVLSRFAGKTVSVGQPAVSFRFWEESGTLWNANEKSGVKTQVHWMFGSGHHGMTPVVVAKNRYGEDEGPDLHVSWYRPHGLALTMGHEPVLTADPDSLGSLNNASDTKQCFKCHTTELTKKGRGIETANLLPGVLCSKCHANAKEHAEKMHGGETASSSFDDWKSLSPIQSVDRCGECHRSPTAFKPEQIQPENRALTRFASVGLPLSRCFQFQKTRQLSDGTARRLDCLTCHDPHRPMTTDPQHYNNVCRDCHSRPDSQDSDCPKQIITSDCVGCHMPKVRMNAPVSFTDHWIRVRSASENAASAEPTSATPTAPK